MLLNLMIGSALSTIKQYDFLHQVMDANNVKNNNYKARKALTSSFEI